MQGDGDMRYLIIIRDPETWVQSAFFSSHFKENELAINKALGL